MIITRKIELWLNATKEETKSEAWKRLRQLENDTFEMANLIVNHQFYNALHKERLMTGEISVIKNTQKALGIALKTEKDKAQKAIIEDKIKANKEKISELMKGINEGIKREFGTSESNSTYQIIGNKYPSVSSEIRTCLNQEVSAYFNKELFNVQRGIRSLRTYKKDLPIPFGKSVIRFYENGKDINFNWVSDFDFKLNFGRDKSNNREIVERVMRGEYDAAGSHIQIIKPKKGDTKIFLLLSVDMPKKEVELKNDICVGIDLGINIPLYAAVNKGFGRMSAFISASYIDASYGDFKTYTSTGTAPNVVITESNLKGNQVEYSPNWILSTGINYSYKRFGIQIQSRTISDIYTDASNVELANAAATNGKIEGYSLFDFSAQYKINGKYNLGFGVNNLADKGYSTRRAGGYPGPGLVSGEGRTWYLSFGVKM